MANILIWGSMVAATAAVSTPASDRTAALLANSMVTCTALVASPEMRTQLFGGKIPDYVRDDLQSLQHGNGSYEYDGTEMSADSKSCRVARRGYGESVVLPFDAALAQFEQRLSPLGLKLERIADDKGVTWKVGGVSISEYRSSEPMYSRSLTFTPQAANP
ncbi:hypothetical protein IC614_05900 [Allosphingosinicella flava]|uniref:Uncharacterized protein n=1 Tax=Allosphingosinicella flava TaxID=2771430 RepID=A0A7T2GLK5_9SPHN|nr:hypothetical protein [Sphingosinicella flava]QPQ56099.1 hypothetical protein IC614_05900 [Sphingosinicella flava]